MWNRLISRVNSLSKRPLGYVLLVVILLGIFLRWNNLDGKVYWVDEVHTATRIAGYTRSDVQEQIFDQGLLQVEVLHQYQVPGDDRPFDDTWQALKQHPEHPPLYFLMGWVWLKGWLSASGDWVLGLRCLSVMISFAVFPALYWLCRELFGVGKTGWMAIALVSISPLHILYAQEARQYSLFTLATVLASAAVLRALRSDRPLDWRSYGATLLIGLYAHLLFGLVAIVHGLYLLLLRVSRQQWRHFLLSFGGALLAFTPWLVVFVRHLGQIERAVDATQRGFDLNYLVNAWLRNLSRVFFSTDLGTANLLLLALVGIALYRLYCDTPRATWLFILLLIAVPALPLMIVDGATGGISSTRIRYLIPSFIGIQLAIAHLFAYGLSISSQSKIQNPKSKISPRFWTGTFAVMMAGMVVASMLDANKSVTWTKSDKGAYYPAIAATINAAANPVVISDSSPTYVLALGRSLRNDVTLNLVTRPNRLENIDNNLATFSDIFIFAPSPQLEKMLTENLDYTLTPVIEQNESFQLLEVIQ